VESGIDRAFIEGALEFARSLGPGLAAGQVRGIFGEVVRQEIGGLDPARLLLLKPRLAYLAARAGRSEMRELRTVLERGLEKVCAEGIPDEERQARFERFSQGLEAILAYHKSHERKQGEQRT
jgi:CRISPR type III-A-associated protein Csm2